MVGWWSHRGTARNLLRRQLQCMQRMGTAASSRGAGHARPCAADGSSTRRRLSACFRARREREVATRGAQQGEFRPSKPSERPSSSASLCGSTVSLLSTPLHREAAPASSTVYPLASPPRVHRCPADRRPPAHCVRLVRAQSSPQSSPAALRPS